MSIALSRCQSTKTAVHRIVEPSPARTLRTGSQLLQKERDAVAARPWASLAHPAPVRERDDNIIIDKTGTAKIIDFGSTKIAGVVEAAPPARGNDILGTVQYTAPEYFLGESGSPRSDMFSLGVISYQMLTGRLPYGSQIAKARTKSQFGKLRYQSALDANTDVPAWIDGALGKAVHPDPNKRYESLSEFTFDLRHPYSKYLGISPTPLIERNPNLFWKCATAILAVIIVVLLASQHGIRH
jgi:serine/threonine protein kinase